MALDKESSRTEYMSNINNWLPQYRSEVASAVQDKLADCIAEGYLSCQGHYYYDGYGLDRGEYYVRVSAGVIYYPDGPGCEINLSHEPGGPEIEWCPSICSDGYVSDITEGTNFDCIVPRQPEECYEVGRAFNAPQQQCSDECEFGMLDGFCLAPLEEEDTCTPGSEGFVGSYGSGNQQVHVCGPASQECKDSGGTFGIVNGQATCLPEEYGAPQCKSGSVNDVLVNDGYGFVCETVGDPDSDQEPPEEPEPNTDTDGDGIPDEYQRENDPDAGNKQRDEIIEGQAKGNEALEGISDRLDQLVEIGKEGNRHLDGIGGGVGELVEMGRAGELAGGGGSGGGEGLVDDDGNHYLADIEQNTRETADALEGPEGGYNTDGKGDASTFGETADRLRLLISDHPTISAVTSVPTIASNTSCPVYTLPANEYFGALTMSVHCQIFDDYRGQLGALFMAIWTLAAVMVFLRA